MKSMQYLTIKVLSLSCLSRWNKILGFKRCFNR